VPSFESHVISLGKDSALSVAGAGVLSVLSDNGTLGTHDPNRLASSVSSLADSNQSFDATTGKSNSI
jgi:hypothetical protein